MGYEAISWQQLPRSERAQAAGLTIDVWAIGPGKGVRYSILEDSSGCYVGAGIRVNLDCAKRAAIADANNIAGSDLGYPGRAAEFSESYWLRDAIAALAKRDPVDALHDVEFLLRVQQERLNEVQRAAGRL